MLLIATPPPPVQRSEHHNWKAPNPSRAVL